MDRITNLQRMLTANPNDPQLHYFLATDLYNAKRYQEAVPVINRYLELSPNDQGAGFRILGISLFETGDRPAAKSALERGILQAMQHGHPSMAQEFRDTLDEWAD